MKILCHWMMCGWMHIADIVVGYNEFNQPITIGLWQCHRCKQLSKGQCGNKPEPETKAILKILDTSKPVL